MERMRALDHLSPLQAAKEWGVPKDALRNAAQQIRQIRAGADRSLARDRPRCPAPVTSFYGFPCKVPVEAGMELCYQHRRTEHRADADLLTYTLAAVQAHESWEALHNRITELDKRALERERLRLLQALEGRTPLHEEDFRLAAMLLPSDDPATQERRALGLPGPNDGIGDGARLRGLGVLLAAAETAALNLPTVLPAIPSAPGRKRNQVAQQAEPAPAGPLLYDYNGAAERLGIKAHWLRTEAAAGRIPYRQVGGHRMFSEEDLAEIVKEAYRPVTPVRRRRF
jgi:hypothetical protein